MAHGRRLTTQAGSNLKRSSFERTLLFLALFFSLCFSRGTTQTVQRRGGQASHLRAAFVALCGVYAVIWTTLRRAWGSQSLPQRQDHAVSVDARRLELVAGQTFLLMLLGAIRAGQLLLGKSGRTEAHVRSLTSLGPHLG